MIDKDLTKQLKLAAKKAGQIHLFRFWNELSENSQHKLIRQIQSIDFELMNKLKKEYLLTNDKKHLLGELEPIPILPLPKTSQQQAAAAAAKKSGEKLLAEGKVAALLVAGGQGSRLDFAGPKGKFPAGPISGKSLFQMHAEKILALNKKYRTNVPWFIMTSEINHEEIVQFFEEHDYFGLNAGDVFFFVQGMLPAMDRHGAFFLAKKDEIFSNPNGHGGTLSALRDNNCLEEMAKRGIEEIFYFQVDNVLIKICDPYFIGYHHLASAEMSAKVIARTDPHEKVGIVGKMDNKTTVIEYSDFPLTEMEARNSDGQLKYSGGSIAIHMMRRDFIEKITTDKLALPFHVAHKRISYLDKSGNVLHPDQPNGYKFEMFIFDALPLAKKSVIMEIAREDEFSPIKNAAGIDSAATAKRHLVNYYGRMLRQAGFDVPVDQNNNLMGTIEISPLFALDTEELKEKLKNNFVFKDNLYLQNG